MPGAGAFACPKRWCTFSSAGPVAICRHCSRCSPRSTSIRSPRNDRSRFRWCAICCKAPNMRRNRLTLFDLVNTLLDGDSDYHWAQYLIAAGVLDGVEYAQRNEAYYQDYLAGRLDIHDFLAFELRP